MRVARAHAGVVVSSLCSVQAAPVPSSTRSAETRVCVRVCGLPLPPLRREYKVHILEVVNHVPKAVVYDKVDQAVGQNLRTQAAPWHDKAIMAVSGNKLARTRRQHNPSEIPLLSVAPASLSGLASGRVASQRARQPWRRQRARRSGRAHAGRLPCDWRRLWWR